MCIVRFRVNADACQDERVCMGGSPSALGGDSESGAVKLTKARGKSGWWISDDIDLGEQVTSFSYRVYLWSKQYGLRPDPFGQDRLLVACPACCSGGALAKGVHVVALQFGARASDTRVHLEWPLDLEASPAKLFGFLPSSDMVEADVSSNGNAAGVGVCPALVVFPGGGYGMLTSDHEGLQVAEWLRGEHVAAFVLTYSVAPVRFPVQLHQGCAAVQWLRRHSHALGLDPARIGVVGFSAGAHLAGLVHTSTREEREASCSKDALGAVGAGADAEDNVFSAVAVLCYPVVTLDHEQVCTHGGSRNNLLGEKASDEELCRRLSLENRISPEVGPTFVCHTCEDSAVPVENSYVLASSLARSSIPHELHVYSHQKVRHGSGLFGPDGRHLPWASDVLQWFRRLGFLAIIGR